MPKKHNSLKLKAPMKELSPEKMNQSSPKLTNGHKSKKSLDFRIETEKNDEDENA